LTKSFADLALRPEVLKSLSAAGFEKPFPIQELVIPIALTGVDLIGQAKTGTGKTLGFGLPIVNSVKAIGVIQALVVVPTRELGVQVAEELEKIGRDLSVAAVYGGRAIEPQIAQLNEGVDILVATPGRLLDLHRQKALDLSTVQQLVLDEADEMLDLGFLPDVEKIFSLTPNRTQTMLFSATMPGDVVVLARKFLNQPTHIRAQEEDSGAVVKNISQFIYRTHALDKAEIVSRILRAEGRGQTMIFCRTKRTCQQLSDDLKERGFKSAAIHGDLGQAARERALSDFKSNKRDVLVATDVAARGIDIDGITHVINYQCPEDEKTFLHRIGRTARAGASGIAVTFVDWDELPRWSHINQALNLGVAEPIETYSSSDHLFSDLRITKENIAAIPKAKKEITKSERPVRAKRDRKRTRKSTPGQQ
jgi:superfamily II DNA/RNA helicase